MLTINIMKLEVNTITNIGSLNIGKSIIYQNRAVSKEISTGAEAAAGESPGVAGAAIGAEIAPGATAVTPTPVIPPVHVVPPSPPIPPSP
jgi:hypothetical protein